MTMLVIPLKTEKKATYGRQYVQRTLMTLNFPTINEANKIFIQNVSRNNESKPAGRHNPTRENNPS
jgi:hypothetical protein